MATHNRKKHSRQSLRNSPEFRELAELMAGIDPERRGDAFKMAESQDTNNDGEEETRTNDIAGGTQASNSEFGENVLPTEQRNRSQSRSDSQVPKRRTRYPNGDR